ncbi:hypothetical protein BDV95DRAFT_588063 [Massariosphaeria phaeospora]|uniref:F-box domain-containing protein n=1 Tax=Massariosphaeria phaeospora TaxID=100035 RepID=A0A7C8HYE5_9PLEO|nr:hypothetical protein BDV95DRAFT_588063 [Massariosphaeria phaeospora]
MGRLLDTVQAAVEEIDFHSQFWPPHPPALACHTCNAAFRLSLHSRTYSNLTTFSISEATIDSELLHGFWEQHQATLRRLQMQYSLLTTGSWVHVFQVLARTPGLRHLRLAGLYQVDDGGQGRRRDRPEADWQRDTMELVDEQKIAVWLEAMASGLTLYWRQREGSEWIVHFEELPGISGVRYCNVGSFWPLG